MHEAINPPSPKVCGGARLKQMTAFKVTQFRNQKLNRKVSWTDLCIRRQTWSRPLASSRDLISFTSRRVSDQMTSNGLRLIIYRLEIFVPRRTAAIIDLLWEKDAPSLERGRNVRQDPCGPNTDPIREEPSLKNLNQMDRKIAQPFGRVCCSPADTRWPNA